MAYALTEQDIAQMIAAGMNVIDAVPGAPATDAEKAFLGVQDDVDLGALPDPVAAATGIDAPQMAAPQVAAAMPPPAAPVTQQQVASADTGGGFNIMDKIFGAKGDEQPNQFANLNRQQRMMLAFGAMRDAGMGLQGKESNSFSSTLKAINDQMDMGRKAKAAQAQQAALKSMLGAGGVGGDIQSQIARLSDMAVMYPSMAPGLALKIKALQDQEMAQAAAEGRTSQASTQLDDVQALLDMIQDDPFMTTGIMSTLLSGVKITQAGQAASLQKTLKSNLALQALKDLKATGATMGALNTTEFQALENELTNLDLGLGADLSKRSLLRIQAKYQSLIADAFRDAKEQAAAGNAMGKKGLEGLTRIFGGEPEWLSTAPPLQITIRPSETPEEFKIRMNIE